MKKNHLIESENKSSTKYWLVLLLLLLVFIYFIPKEIEYPKYKSLTWFGFVLIFMILPYFVFKVVKSINKYTSSIKTYGICALSILIVGPTHAIFGEYRQEKELEINGNVTKCVVVDRKKSKNDWLINCKYYANNAEFVTYYHTDEKNKYRIGDTIQLIYNKDFPRMYKIDFQ
jgi:glucan phosphoethanolaminetransferase (alkaline phosphatase superfamily)